MIEVFGSVDKDKEGKVNSEYPAWYFDRQKKELEESIAQARAMIDGEYIASGRMGIAKEELRQMEDRLKEIEKSKPKLEGKEKDEIAKVVKDVGGNVKSTMFTYSEMHKGLADAHEEASRMVNNDVVELKGAAYEFAKKCGIPLDGNKTSRTGAEKMWKIGRKLLGEMSNAEVLRSPK